MEIKLKKPSQESINQAYKEVCEYITEGGISYETLTNNEKSKIHFEFCHKDVLDRAYVIENFEDCKPLSDFVQELIVDKENGTTFWKQRYVSLSTNPLTDLQYHIISQTIDDMVEKFSDENNEFGKTK